MHPGHLHRCVRLNASSDRVRQWLLGLSAGCLLQAGSLPLAAVELRLSVDPEVSTTGTFTVRWSAENPDDALHARPDAPYHYQLTRIGPSGRQTLYVGRDTARFESGLPDGEYEYRVTRVAATDASALGGTAAGPANPAAGGEGWAAPASSLQSAPVTARVTHHSLNRAFTAFSIGALIFGTLAFWVTRHA